MAAYVLLPASMEPRFWVFVGLVALLTITPGADTALVVRSTLSRGKLEAVTGALFLALGVRLAMEER